jgi:hypothetical protein
MDFIFLVIILVIIFITVVAALIVFGPDPIGGLGGLAKYEFLEQPPDDYLQATFDSATGDYLGKHQYRIYPLCCAECCQRALKASRKLGVSGFRTNKYPFDFHGKRGYNYLVLF